MEPPLPEFSAYIPGIDTGAIDAPLYFHNVDEEAAREEEERNKAYFGDGPSAYKVLEDIVGLTLWESNLDARIQGEDCSKLATGNPVYTSLALSHFMFGDPFNWRKLSHYFLQATGAVIDGTHAFETLHTILLIMVESNTALEIEGNWSLHRESCILFPWGTGPHIRRCLSVPVRLLDVRAKECVASLIARGGWSHSSVCPLKNITKASAFLYEEPFGVVFKFWSTMYITLFIHYTLREMKLLSVELDVRPDFEALINEMCSALYKSPDRNRFYSDMILPGDGRSTTKTFRTSSRDDSSIVIQPTLPKYSHVPRPRPPTFTIQTLTKPGAQLLRKCYRMAKKMKEKDILQKLGGLLLSNLYPESMNIIGQARLEDKRVPF